VSRRIENFLNFNELTHLIKRIIKGRANLTSGYRPVFRVVSMGRRNTQVESNLH